MLDFLFEIIVEIVFWYEDSEKLPKTLSRILRLLFALVLIGFTVFTLYQGFVCGKREWLVLTFIFSAYMIITIFMYFRRKKIEGFRG